MIAVIQNPAEIRGSSPAWRERLGDRLDNEIQHFIPAPCRRKTRFWFAYHAQNGAVYGQHLRNDLSADVARKRQG